MTMVEDQRQVLVDWNDTAVDYPRDRCLHELFEDRVRRTPDAPAVVHLDERVTAAELDARANRLAHELVDRGVGPEVLVGLCLERGVDLVVAALAVLKAGGGYVPFDPHYPSERLARMLADTAAPVVLTRRDVSAAVLGSVTTLFLDELAVEHRPETPPDSRADPDNVAVVLYTSGSTGTPKGAVLTHRGLVRLVWPAAIASFDDAEVSGMIASPSFDASAFEMWNALIQGARLAIYPAEVPTAEGLGQFVRRHGVTTMVFTTGFFHTVVDTAVEVLDGLRQIVVGGEVLSPAHCARAVARTPGLRIVNVYGPTECSAVTCCSTFDPAAGAGDVLPIGRLIPNTRTYLLDDELKPVPVGTPGEAYIAGDGLGRAFWNRPDMTAERFVADPFGAPGARMYRTGDLLRWRADGTLEFVSRVDDQVKVRGFRIEPGEIENVLASHPAVTRAVVVVHDDGAGRARLVGYLTGTGIDVDDVAGYAAGVLPEHMVPSALVVLDEFPLNPNGKVDRRALPEPVARSGAGGAAPSTPAERVLARLWAEVLGVDDVGVHDDFFADLDGNSLLAMRLVSRAREVFGDVLSARALFDTPTVAALAALLPALPEAPDQVIPVVPRQGALPLSFAQQGIWIMAELAPDGTDYNTAAGLRLTGELDREMLRVALDRLVARHEPLRTTFVVGDGRGAQVVHPHGEVPLDVIAVPGDDRDAVDRVLRDRTARPFDLANGPLSRALLLVLAEDEHILVLDQHHIITDGWSVGVLVDELLRLYAEARTGVPAELPPLRVQLADVAAWERERLGGAALERQLDYWRRQLADLVQLELPTDRRRPPVRSGAGAAFRFELPPALVTRLSELGQQHNATLFMTLIAAVQVLLAGHSGQDDIAIGTVTAGRDQPELESLLGFFVRTLVIRSRIDSAEPFTGFLGRVRETVLAAFAHQELPFERLVEALRPDRDAGSTALVQCVVALQEPFVRPREVAGLQVEEHPLPRISVPYDLFLEFWPHDGGLTAVVNYSTALFDAATVEGLAARLRVLLTAVADGPPRPVRELPLLTGAEHRLLAAGGAAGESGAPHASLPGIFAATATRTPGATAVVDGSVSLTYRELDHRANALAHRLVAEGVRVENPVAVLMARSADLVVAELAVLKAGGAYLPLEVSTPVARLRATFAAARPAALLLDPARLGLAGEIGFTGPVVVVEGDARVAELPPVSPHPQNVAYVMYTSGSTGMPKGVMVCHRDVAALAFDSRYRGGGHERVLLHSPSAFDASTYETWVPLLNGGRVVVAPAGGLDADAVRQLVDEHALTAVFLTEGLFRQFAEQDPSCFRGVRELWTGGDAVSADSVRRVLTACPDVVVVDAYGPTEATTIATAHSMTSARPPAGVVPIGTPFDGVRVYVLDRGLRLVPPGSPGEMYLAGAGIARGYLNEPGLTAERFVANPFGGAGSVMYRTGDLVRWRAGVLEFLGRTDDQVKVRGFRIEPGEIEAALLRQDGVGQAVVSVVRGDNRAMLVGYLVAEAGARVDHDRVRAALAEELPAHLVPAAFVTMDALPLNRNEKVDRAALPAPDVRVSRQAPRTETEQVLAGIWADLLGLPAVGVEDNFFKLGGDSILGLQVAYRARQRGLDIASRDLFRWQTVSSLAAHTVRATGGAGERTPATGPAPLTPIQHWFFENHQVDPHHFAQTVRVRLAQTVDESALRTALAAVVAHHDALRARYENVDGRWRQHVQDADATDVLVAHDLAAEDAVAGLDLTTGPLVAAVLFPDSLLLAAHHLVVDGVSWRVLLEDLETAYRQALCGDAPDLGRKTTSFREWALRLSAHAEAGGFASEADHWTSLPAPAPLPVDGAGPNTPGSARVVRVRLDREETALLLRQAPRAYRTQVNDILLCALAAVLARWTESDRVLVDLEGHGREDLFDDVDLSRTVGWFTALFPVALEVPPAAAAAPRLKAVKEQLRAVPSRGVGYGVLRYLAGVDTGPRPEVSFNYLGTFAGAGSLYSGLELGLDECPDGVRPHLLDVVGVVVGDSLEFQWIHSEDLHRERTVRRLAEEFLTELRLLIEHCAGQDAGGCTPSDFPLAELDQETVDRIVGDGRSVQDIYPLTPMQSGMLFHSIVDRSAGLYVEQASMVLAGVEEPELLGAAWQRVADRVPVLRTALVWADVPTPLQVVHTHVELGIDHLDWRSLDDPARQRARRDCLREHRVALSDLTAAPLVRVALARLGGSTVELLWTFHHALLDGWSLAQVLEEVFGEYAALAGGPPFEPPVRRPYRDFVEWLQGQDTGAAEQHWRRALAGLTSPTPLPFDRQRPEGHRSPEPADLSVELTAELSRALQEVAKRAEVTVNTLVQGIWAVLLARFGGTTDVCFGATAAGRPATLDGADTIAGLFINTLPVRVHVDRAANALDWLGGLQAAQADARGHEHVSLSQVQEWSELPVGVSLFDSVVVFENYPFDPGTAPAHGVEVVAVHSDNGTNYPLTLIAYPGERLALRLNYDATLFDRPTVARLARGLQVLLDDVATDPDRPLAAFDVLTDAERHELLVAWNDTGAPFPADRCLHELIDDQVRRAPGAVALTHGHDSVTYAELAVRANGLAHRLAGLGVGPDVVVGVCLPRGIDLVVAELAVLKAGGAYVPLDPDAPPSRSLFIVGDTRAAVVLTTSAIDVPWPSAVAVVRLDLDEVSGPDTPPVTAVRPDNLAYVIYTSGSTGEPKGVMVEHRNLVQLCTWQVRDYEIGPGDRSCPLAALSFDASVWELWPYLLAGARLDVPERRVLDDTAEMVAWFARMGTTICYLLPARVDVLMDEPELVNTRLRLVLTGGDTVRRRPSPGTAWRLVNHYGATEMTVVSTGGEVRQDGRGLPAVGGPLANATAYVLDASLRPVPVGTAGEIYLGGLGLSRGYRGRPDLTAERFVACPFGPPGSRIYRTGDVGRWNREGQLEFIGRTDDQVKIRGFRVEPGEVEHALLELPGVTKAVVSVSRRGDRASLVAHVVGAPQADLRAALAARLPEHLVPSAFVRVDDIPLTAHGKVDRKALPPPDWTASAYAAPRDPTETALARIFAEVLEVDRAGVHDDFFELGGDSITSLKLASRIRRSFGVPVSPRDLFEARTIAALADVLRDRVLSQLVAAAGDVPE